MFWRGLLLFAAAQSQQTTGICSRTAQVRTAILAAVSAVNACSLVTSTHLASIQSLNLSNRSITSLAAGDFAGLTGLTTLSLYNNSISTLPASLFDDLTALTTLSLYGNSLTTLPSAIFTSLTSLTKLYLSQNKLSSLNASLFSGLSSLTALTLNGNALTTLPTALFTGLSALQSLHLYNNKLASLPASVFTGLSALEQLDLSHNKLPSLSTSLFTGLSNLQILNLSNNSLASLSASPFTGLSKLQILDLSHNSQTSLPTGLFTGLSALEHLHLNSNSQLTLTSSSFAGLSALKRLYLQDNGMTSLPSNLFKDLTALQILDLSGNSLSSLPAPTRDSTSPQDPDDTLLSALPASPFAGPTRLQQLFLNHNLLKGLNLGVFTGLTSLQILDLRCNGRRRITDACPLNGSLSLQLNMLPLGNGRMQITLLEGAPYTLSVKVTATNSAGTINTSTTTTLPAGAASREFSISGLAGTVELSASITNAASMAAFRGLSIDSVTREDDFLNFSGQAGDQILTTNTPATLTLPVATGSSNTIGYILSATATDGTHGLPAGLSFDGRTRELTGTPTAPGTYTMNYIATAGTGSVHTTQTFTLIVVDALELTDPDDQVYIKDQAIETRTLPQASGGSQSYTYTLSATTTDGTLTSTLPAGLSFNGNTRQLTGTPTALGTYTLRYTVTDARAQSAEQTFTLTVVDALTLTDLDNQVYIKDQAIETRTLPQASSGSQSYTYTLSATTTDGTLTGTLPAGLSFNGNTRQLTGTPTALGTYTLRYTVTDTHALSAEQTFTLTVVDALELTDPDDQVYIKDQAIETRTLPQASGGSQSYTYTLTATTTDGTLTSTLPAGLSFSGNTRQLTGTPTARGTYTLTYTATDTHALSAEQTFTLTVVDALELTNPDNQVYIKDQAIETRTLPQASGGSQSYTYALTGNLPAGLSFNGNTRQLTGTPTALGTYTLRYTVTDTHALSAEQTFTLTVVDALELTDPDNQVYIKDQAIETRTLPQASGGSQSYTYTLSATTTDGTLTSTLPAGLSFNGNTRQLTGTPTARGTYTLTYTATDTHALSAEQTFTLTVVDALTLTDPDDQTYNINRAITTLTLPQATGGSPSYTYTLTGNLPAGLSFNNSTRQLTGTPTALGTYTLTYTVTDTHSRSATQTFTLNVVDGPVLTEPDDQVYIKDRAIATLTLPQATGGSQPYAYALMGNLPAGLHFDDSTRELTGTPTALGTYTLTYTVTDTNALSTKQTFTLTVVDVLALADPDDQVYIKDQAIATLTLPQATGGSQSYTYTLMGNLPAGLSFNANSRQLTGTPTALGTYTLTYTVTDTHSRSATQTFTLIVSEALILADLDDQTYIKNRAIATLTLPQATGGSPPYTYTLTGNLPAGLSFNDNTRQLTGTPTALGTYTLTYTVTDTNALSTKQTFTLAVVDVLALADPDDQVYIKDQAIATLTLPQATGGSPSYTYALMGNLPAGLSFNANSTRQLTGTPTALGTYTLTYTVTDTHSRSATQTFTLIVSEALILADLDDQTYIKNRAIATLTLPQATGGNQPYTYTLTDNLPTGLDFDDSTRELTGTPTALGTYTLTYTVTDTNALSTKQTFTLTVIDALALADPDDQVYIKDQAIAALTLPQATGGISPYTYILTVSPDDGTLVTDLPAGLSFDLASRTLTGTPLEIGTYTLTYIVTDSTNTRLSQSFTIDVKISTLPLMQLEESVLQGMALSLTLDASRTISDRFTQLLSAGSRFTVAADGSSFTLPLRSRHPEGLFGDIGGGGSLTLWMESSTRELTHDSLGWDGELTETLVGLDGVIGRGLMLGLAWSQSAGDYDYDIPDHVFQGGYSTQAEMLYAYLSWGSRADRLRIWTMLGTGSGNTTLRDRKEDPVAGDFDITTSVLGIQSNLVSTSLVDLKLRIETSGSDLQIPASALRQSMATDSSQTRVVLENAWRLNFSGGSSFGPVLQIASQQVENSTLFDSATEIGGSLRYVSGGKRFSFEMGGRQLEAEEVGYSESGAYLAIQLRVAGGGRGLSFSLAPTRGSTFSKIERIWQGGGDIIASDQATTGRDTDSLDGELAYGLSTGGRGLITPYSRYSWGGQRSDLALGARWQIGSHFHLELERNRRHSDGLGAEAELRLRGRLSF